MQPVPLMLPLYRVSAESRLSQVAKLCADARLWIASRFRNLAQGPPVPVRHEVEHAEHLAREAFVVGGCEVGAVEAGWGWRPIE
jgi:hypothetical protein